MKRLSAFTFPLLVVIVFTLISCERDYRQLGCPDWADVECGEDSNKYTVRVANLTDFIMCNVRVTFRTDIPAGKVIFGNIQPQTTSCYTIMDTVKAFPTVQYEIGEKTFTTQDTLRDTKRPYFNTFLKTPGLYTLNLAILGDFKYGVTTAAYIRD